MFRRLLPLAILFLLIGVGVLQAQDALPPLPECDLESGWIGYSWYWNYHVLRGIEPRHEIRNRRLVLANPLTGEEVRVVETSFDARHIEWYSWSPDCHYMFAEVDQTGYVWDLVENRRLATIENANVLEPPHWNPYSSTPTMILHIRRGNFLWHVGQSEPILLTFSGEHRNNRPFHGFAPKVEWDDNQNEFFFTPYPGDLVIAYDATTGQVISSYDNGDRKTPLDFTFSSDCSKLIVFTSGESYSTPSDGATVWDLSTHTGITVAAPWLSASRRYGAFLSVDNRYLILPAYRVGLQREGWHVWDLQNLPAEVEARDPAYFLPDGSLRFVSNMVVEITSDDGDVSYWDVSTGQQVEQQ